MERFAASGADNDNYTIQFLVPVIYDVQAETTVEVVGGAPLLATASPECRANGVLKKAETACWRARLSKCRAFNEP